MSGAPKRWRNRGIVELNNRSQHQLHQHLRLILQAVGEAALPILVVVVVLLLMVAVAEILTLVLPMVDHQMAVAVDVKATVAMGMVMAVAMVRVMRAKETDDATEDR
jgi:hypothetical protein